jgi:hypothetical protein
MIPIANAYLLLFFVIFKENEQNDDTFCSQNMYAAYDVGIFDCS